MVFSSLVFLCGFLPVVLIVYQLCPVKCRNFFLFIASLFFYAWGEPVYLLIMLFSTVFDYANGRMLEYFDRRNRPGMRKAVVVFSVVVNIGILAFFKYTDFLLTSLGQLTGHKLPLLELALPIGISFYTFQTLSYTIDVYRRLVPAQHDIISFGMYVCLFPQLIAGPIVRYQDISQEINERKTDWQDRADGMFRFLIGLAKKVLLANQAGDLWREIDGLPLQALNLSSAWLGALAFTFQIYFDFSGYSDMAIGLGRLLGFHFPENFNYPYLSKSLTEFWRRWHMTLGTWFREYVYIPLGGNRKGAIRQIFNLLVVWFLTGMWHGAGWNFILWGLYFFVLLLVEKFFLREAMERWPSFFRHCYAMFFITVGWVIFACTDLNRLLGYLKALFGGNGTLTDDFAIYHWREYGLLLIIFAIGCLPIAGRTGRWLLGKMSGKSPDWAAVESTPAFEASEKTLVKEKQGQPLEVATAEEPAGTESMKAFVLKWIFAGILLVASFAFLVSGSYNPFLYFRF